MDLLGSILDSMEKPPQTTTKQDMLLKKQQDDIKKLQEIEKKKLKTIRSDLEKQIVDFVKNDELQKHEFPTMDKLFRSIIHDIAEKYDLSTYSFGVEGVDRHSVVYKKEFRPSDEELEALRNGDSYERKLQELQHKMKLEADSKSTKTKEKFTPTKNYKLKYANIIGLDAGEAAAKITTPNQQFGMVPSSSKRDLRSIEQILNDNKVKKMKHNQ